MAMLNNNINLETSATNLDGRLYGSRNRQDSSSGGGGRRNRSYSSSSDNSSISCSNNFTSNMVAEQPHSPESLSMNSFQRKLHPHLPDHSPAARSYNPGAGGSTGIANDNYSSSVGALRTTISGGGSTARAVGVMVMIYGSAEACARIGGCGLTFMPTSSFKRQVEKIVFLLFKLNQCDHINVFF